MHQVHLSHLLCLGPACQPSLSDLPCSVSRLLATHLVAAATATTPVSPPQSIHPCVEPHAASPPTISRCRVPGPHPSSSLLRYKSRRRSFLDFSPRVTTSPSTTTLISSSSSVDSIWPTLSAGAHPSSSDCGPPPSLYWFLDEPPSRAS
jgi:hypothetical protein